MSYTNKDTERIIVWIENDSDFVHTAQVKAKADRTGKALSDYLTGLLNLTDDGTPITNQDQRHGLTIVRNEIALAYVDWAQVREEVLSVNL